MPLTARIATAAVMDAVHPIQPGLHVNGSDTKRDNAADMNTTLVRDGVGTNGAVIPTLTLAETGLKESALQSGYDISSRYLSTADIAAHASFLRMCC
jgi:hypothetical protein